MLPKLERRMWLLTGTVLTIFSLAFLSSSLQKYTLILEIAQEPVHLSVESVQAIDYKYCGGPCRFINILHLPEQETRSQVHLRHIAFTAGLVNRTLVLPNVGASRIGACLPHDFSYYYDMQWARDHEQYFNTITMHDFRAWLEERKAAQAMASSSIMSVVDQDTDSNIILSGVHNCFSHLLRPLSDINLVMAWNTADKFIKQGEDAFVNFVRGTRRKNHYSNDRIEVIQMVYTKGNPFSKFSNAMTPIPYSPFIVALADKTSQEIQPYVAIHWRMETITKTSNLVVCARRLMDTLNQTSLHDMNAFLLTDYPHRFTQEQQTAASEGTATPNELKSWLKSPSSTFHFKSFNTHHHQAIQMLYQHHPFYLFDTAFHSPVSTPATWHLLPLPAAEDSGWIGILDKLMAIRATYFLAGRPKYCARGSTFTAQITNERFIDQPTRKPIEYFG